MESLGEQPETLVTDPSSDTDEPLKLRELIPTMNEKRSEIVALKDEVLLDLCSRIEGGFSTVQCLSWLMKTHGLTLEGAGLMMDHALHKTIGTMDHTSWTNQYRLMAGDLYQKAVASGNVKNANSILNTMVKLQYLAQSNETKGRELGLNERKVKAWMEINEPKRELEKGGDVPTQQGFRLTIETVSATQSMPANHSPVIEISNEAPVKSESSSVLIDSETPSMDPIRIE